MSDQWVQDMSDAVDAAEHRIQQDEVATQPALTPRTMDNWRWLLYGTCCANHRWNSISIESGCNRSPLLTVELSSQSKVAMLELVGHWLEVLHELVEGLEVGLLSEWRLGGCPAGTLCVAENLLWTF